MTAELFTDEDIAALDREIMEAKAAIAAADATASRNAESPADDPLPEMDFELNLVPDELVPDDLAPEALRPEIPAHDAGHRELSGVDGDDPHRATGNVILCLWVVSPAALTAVIQLLGNTIDRYHWNMAACMATAAALALRGQTGKPSLLLLGILFPFHAAVLAAAAQGLSGHLSAAAVLQVLASSTVLGMAAYALFKKPITGTGGAECKPRPEGIAKPEPVREYDPGLFSVN